MKIWPEGGVLLGIRHVKGKLLEVCLCKIARSVGAESAAGSAIKDGV